MSSESGNANFESPTKAQLSTLLEHYQTGRLSDAENLAISITKRFPKHLFAWKVLGAVLGQTGRKSEGINANRKAVALSPTDAESHSNLGVMLQELGRLVEAETSLIQALALKPDNAKTHYNLGITLKEQGRLDDAEASYKKALVLDPDYAKAHNNLGAAYKEMGKLDKAEASYKRAIALQPDYAEAHNNLGATLTELGRLDEAESSYKYAIALKPEYSSAKHMLSALIGETTATAPRDYVEGMFDNYADKFESSLVDNLGYKIPRYIADMILKDSKFDLLGSIMDLGCGTGLFGNEIRQYCKHLEGVDLSKKMLDKAKKKNIYNKLIRQDILTFLSNESLNFDYFISADVFIYVGDLSDIFRLIKSRNKKCGQLAFSTEDCEGEGFFLEQSGRYSHSKKYIEDLCEKFGYKLRHSQNLAIRKEKDQYISGSLYLLDF